MVDSLLDVIVLLVRARAAQSYALHIELRRRSG
jgi:hypothetical protein